MKKLPAALALGGAALAAFAAYRGWRRVAAQERARWRDALRPFVPKPLREAIAMARLTRLSQTESYREVGQRYFRCLRDLAGLQPTDRVLDVGSGFARVAHTLTGYLRDGGSYDGLEILEGEVKWCRRQISARHPNFRFQFADIYNEYYHRQGTQTAAEFQFPYGREAFDIVYLVSVFTHMLPTELDHYLSEIARVLKPGGRCLITYFLLNPDAEARGASEQFPFEANGCRVQIQTQPEYAVAYEEDALRSLYETHGLHIQSPIHYGTWCGRESGHSNQDIIVARKPL